MADIIELLPDSVANQIAAGEVIQRPASVVKELLENSIDAGATSIKLITKDAGKSLIQIIDNGSGMSETDARMCFERHATSKIKKAEDLFFIKTKGFRGEAMASIAAIAQVSLRTKMEKDEIGVQIDIEGSEVIRHEPIACYTGTSISVKNLFYNIPARRKFLKSDSTEIKNIVDEFHRVALAHPEVSFELYSNDNDLFNLHKSQLRQRIIGVFGKSYNEKLVPVEEETSIVKISGYIGKPEHARKTRGEQFFFVNDRFIKSSYLHHAVSSAYSELIQSDAYPSYFLFLEVDPALIDINIHPTKTEIKFEDEKSIYSIIRSAVRQSIGKHNISPTIDFNVETSFNIPPPSRNEPIRIPKISVDETFNPFFSDKLKSSVTASERNFPEQIHRPNDDRHLRNTQNWEKLYEGFKSNSSEKTSGSLIIQSEDAKQSELLLSHDETIDIRKPLLQLNRKYVLTSIKSGFVVIHQQRAHERILYEKFIKSITENRRSVQQILFPKTIEMSVADIALVQEIGEELTQMGFEFRELNKTTLVIEGLPSEAIEADLQKLFEQLIEELKNGSLVSKNQRQEMLARSLSKNAGIKTGDKLETQEMCALINELFGCEMPYSTPSGKSILMTTTTDDLDKKFN